MSDLTSNSCNDCDKMFYPEFKELLDYSIEKYNAINKLSDGDETQELSTMPMV